MKRLAMVIVALALATGALSRYTQAQAPISARYALGTNVSSLNVDSESLVRVLDYLRQVSGANIIVNWKVLESVGVARETPITLQVKGLPLRKVLQLVLDQASPNAQLVYTVSSNIVDVTTQEDADRKLITKVYIVDDLLLEPVQKRPPNLSLGQTSAANISIGSVTGSGQTTGSGGSQQGLFGDTSNQANFTTQQPRTAQDRGDQLANLIRQVVRPNIWVENGGQASIRFYQGKLIVNAPASVHEMIGGPLDR